MKQPWSIFGFSTALLLLLLVAGLNWHHSTQMRQAAAWVARTHEVQAELNRLLSLAQDVETGARGFVVTGGAEFLEPFTDGITRLTQQQERVRRLLADEALLSAFAAVPALIAERIAISSRNVDLRQTAGFDAARDAMSSGDGKAVMDELRAHLRRMDETQEQLLKDRSVAAERQAVVVRNVTLSGTASGLLLLVAVFAVVLRENRLRRLAEAALRDSEEHVRLALHGGDLGLWDWNVVSGEVRFNERWAQMLGYELTEFDPHVRTWERLLHPEDTPQVMTALTAHLEGRTQCYETEHRMRTKDGRWLWILDRGRVVARDATGKALRAAGTHLDVTERKRMESELRELTRNLEQLVEQRTAELTESERRHRTLLGNLPGLAYRCRNNPQWTMELVSEGSRSLLGLEPTDLTSGRMHLADLIHPEDRDRVWDTVQEYLADRRPCELEYRIRHADGTWRWVHERAQGVFSPTGETSAIEGFIMDITTRKQTEAEIERLALVARETENAVIIADPAGRIEWVNDGFVRMTGYPLDEVKGLRPGSFLRGADTNRETARQMRERLAQGKGFDIEIVNYTKAGQPFWAGVSVQPLHDKAGNLKGFFAITANISQRKQAERQLLRSQRLESIGTLAGGLAHDLNNALAPILMGLTLLRTEMPGGKRIIATMEASVRRGANMVRRLLAFAKGAEGARLTLASNRLIMEMEDLIAATFPKNIALKVDLAPDAHAIRGDSTQLHQVLLNLCVNARDAMPDGGTLTLESQNVEVDATFASASPEASPGSYVVWRVTDTGSGIPPEIIDRIFDPFFTTKGPDKGTGLGLATVLGIVKGHRAFLRVYSVPGKGSTFAVYLPAAAADEAEPDALPKECSEFRANGEMILFVDDEEPIRETARRVLTALNFQVLTAADGTEALLQVAEQRTHLRLVITDLHMPHMDGLTFVRVLRRMLPEAGIIVASGRLDDSDAQQFAALGVTTRLDKPFGQDQLIAALQAVLQT